MLCKKVNISCIESSSSSLLKFGFMVRNCLDFLFSFEKNDEFKHLNCIY